MDELKDRTVQLPKEEFVVEGEGTRAYKRRWYILFIYSLLSICQAVIFNTWSPISVSAKYTFGWTDSNFILLSSWGSSMYLVTICLTTWIMDVKGMRWACVGASFLVAAGAACRCITMEPRMATWLIHVGHVLNGLSGGVCCAAGPLLSNVWFPVSQRTTVTAAVTVFTLLGGALSFIIAPLAVRKPTCVENCSSFVEESNITYDISVEEVSWDIHRLMFIEAGVCVAVFVSMLLYFPAKPPTPPSVSASKKRVDYKRGVFTLLRKYQVFAIGVPYALTGVYGSWMSLLGVILQDKVSQDEAAYLGFWSSIAGILVAVLFARISDLFAGHLKAAVLILLFVSAGSYTWFAALIETFVLPPVPGWIAMTYISIILGGICEIALQPFGLELACEASYPVAEGVTAGLLTALYNGVAVVFFFSFMIPQVDIQYMNWVLVAAVVVSIPLTISYRESYQRLGLDSR